MKYSIRTVIKNQKYILNKVEEPTYLMQESDMIRKNMVLGYVASNFREEMDEMSDITEIKYMYGRNVLFKYKY